MSDQALFEVAGDVSNGKFIERLADKCREDFMRLLRRFMSRRFGLALFFPSLTLIGFISRRLSWLLVTLVQRTDYRSDILIGKAKILGSRSDQRMCLGTETTLLGNDRRDTLGQLLAKAVRRG